MSGKLKTSGTLFLTRSTWRSTGGLPGFLLTAADGLTRACSVVAPEGIRRSVSSWGAGGFINRSFFALRLREVTLPPQKQAEAGTNGTGGASASASAQAESSQGGAAAGAKTQARRGSAAPSNSLLGYACLDEAGDKPGVEWWQGHVTPSGGESDLQRSKREKRKPDLDDASLVILPVLCNPHSVLQTPQHPVVGGRGRPTITPTQFGSDSVFPLTRRAMNSLFQECLPMSQVEERQASLSYICRTPDRRGKFDVEKAQSFGLKSGPTFGKLTNGQSVIAPDGRVVEPHEVMSEAQQGVAFMVVDCPTVAHFEDFKASPAVVEILQSNENLAYVFHLSPGKVVDSEVYTSWVESLSAKGTLHVLMNDQADDGIVFAGSQAHTEHLRQACEEADIFFTPRGSEGPQMSTAGHGTNVIAAQHGMLFHCSPKPGRDFSRAEAHRDAVDVENMQNLVKGTQAPFRKTLDDSAAGGLDESLPEYIPNPDHPCVTFLGTGSAVPSKYRNVTGMLLHSSSAAQTAEERAANVINATPWAVLFDGGEGTFGQLVRRFGRRAVDEILVDHLRCILVSHMHADHHAGIIQILTERQRAFARLNRDGQQGPILVCGPRDLGHWLSNYDTACEPLRYSFIWNKKLSGAQGEANSSSGIPSALTTLLQGDELKSIRAFPVVHCPDAYGHAVTGAHRQVTGPDTVPWGFAFSGDTRPCRTLIQAVEETARATILPGGGNNTMLVHEATLEDEMQADAKAKNHSTTGDALEVGRQSRANQVVLSHFSQRYPRFAKMSDGDFNNSQARRSLIDRPLVAFDFMTLRIGDWAQHLRYSNSLTTVAAVLSAFLVVDNADEGMEDEDEE